MTREEKRLQEARDRRKHWKRWGPYVSERAWGTVREDYSAYGEAWDYFPHDHARSRAYRWNEDGLGAICDRHQFLCFGIALWNERDWILKERLFGLTGNEGNHGEAVKEYYYYLDSTPTHSYMKMLYRYPQREFPYGQLAAANRARGKDDPEYELIDTGIFAENRYFDVFVSYAKAAPNDLLIRIEVVNRGPEAADLTLLPTLWYRNTWSWGIGRRRGELTASRVRCDTEDGVPAIAGAHPIMGEHLLLCEGADELLFTENDTNLQRLFGAPNQDMFVKDGFHEYVVRGDGAAVNRAGIGTKAGALYRRQIAPGGSLTLRLRLVCAPGET